MGAGLKQCRQNRPVSVVTMMVASALPQSSQARLVFVTAAMASAHARSHVAKAARNCPASGASPDW